MDSITYLHKGRLTVESNQGLVDYAPLIIGLGGIIIGAYVAISTIRKQTHLQAEESWIAALRLAVADLLSAGHVFYLSRSDGTQAYRLASHEKVIAASNRLTTLLDTRKDTQANLELLLSNYLKDLSEGRTDSFVSYNGWIRSYLIELVDEIRATRTRMGRRRWARRISPLSPVEAELTKERAERLANTTRAGAEKI